MSWPMVKLGDVCKLINGDRGKNYPSKDALFSEGVPFINAGNLEDDLSIKCSGANYITEERFDLLSNGKVQIDDILFCLRGSLGKFAIVGTEFSKGAIASSLVIIRPLSRLDRNYLKNYLRSTLCKQEIERFENGAAQPNLSAKDLKEFEIPLPPLPEQKRIAAILDKADAIRRKRQQAIHLADDFLRAVFLEMFGDPVTNPKGWEVKTLGELCAKITDGEHGTVKRLESGKLYLMARNIDRKGNLDLSDVSYIGEADHQRIYKRCGPEKGDVLLVCVGATIGKALIVPDIGEFSLARSVALLKPGKKIISEYLLSLINTEALQRQFVSSGNSSAQAGLYLGKIKEIMVPVPSLEEQIRFRKVVDFVKEKFYSKIESGNLESDFVLGLSQKAFSGQL